MGLWLNQHPLAGAYLTVAAVATWLLILCWVLSPYAPGRPQRRWWSTYGLRLLTAVACGGWIALAARNEWDRAEPQSLLLGLGIAAALFLALVLLPEVGESVQTRHRRKTATACMGLRGSVYKAITAEEVGIVEVEQQGKVVRLSARAQGRGALAAFMEIEVIDVASDGAVIVQAR